MTGAVAALLVSSVLTACGVPGGSAAERVEDDAVPYRLLDPASPATEDVPHGQPPGPAPTVFWLRGDRLVPATAEASCDDDPAAVVELLLTALAGGPMEDERATGRSTAIPPESDLVLVDLQDGVASVDLDPATVVSADRLPAAVGQVTLTVSSAPGVRSVLLVDDGEPVPVPLPGGALTSEPVGAEDYASLLSTGLRRDTVAGCRTD